MAINITEENVSNIIHSPALIQQLMLTDIAETTGNELSNNSTPFASLLEYLSVMTSGLSNECKNVMRSKFPVLADTMEDLFPHLTDEEIVNIFSTPSEATFTFHVYAFSLIDNGYKDPNDPNYMQAKLPVGTTVTIKNVTFTLLNPILIKIHTVTKVPYVTMLPSANPLAYTDKGNLNAKLTHDNNNNPYISFDVPMKQIVIKQSVQDIALVSNCSDSIKLTDKYCYSQIYNTRTASNGAVETGLLPQVYSSEYLNPSVAQAYITLGEDKVSYNISAMYIKSEMVKGKITFVVYETKGEYFSPLDNYKPSDFTVSMPDYINNSDPSIVAAPRLKLVANGVGAITGGANRISTEELKQRLINNTTGPIQSPVTQYHIDTLAKNYGYSIKLVEDLLTNRVYTAYKDLPTVSVNSIKAIPDIFINTVKFTLDELKTLYPNSIKEGASVIRSNTVFKENNGQVSLVNMEELKDILNGRVTARNNYFKTNKHFYSPFTVVIENESGYTNSRYYNVDIPSINSLKIESKNLNISSINVNVKSYGINRLDNGYKIFVEMEQGAGFENLPSKHKKVYFVVKLKTGGVAYQALYDEIYGIWYINLLVDDFIDSDDYLTLTNAPDVGTEYLCPLVTDITIYTCITDPANYDNFETLIEEIKTYNIPTDGLTMISKDTLNVTLGKRLDYVWNKLFTTYDSRKYKRYKEDIYLTYEHDVVGRDQYGNPSFKISPDKSTLEKIILHKKGDYVLDDNGEKIIKYRKNDVILDDNGDPIVDTISELVRYVDIIMMEYEFKLTDELTYKRMMELMMSYFDKMLTSELPSINNNLLEKTSILYKPNKTSEQVTIVSDNITTKVPYVVEPNVYVYVDKSVSVSEADKEVFKQQIGDIIVSNLKNKTIKLNDIKVQIISKLDMNIKAVKIEGLSPNDAEIIYIHDKSSLLTLGKVVKLTDYKTNIVTYNIEVDFVRI